MYLVKGGRHLPGTVLKVRSTHMPIVEHWGMVCWPDPATGEARVIHGMKNDSFRVTLLVDFHRGQSCTVVWVPTTREQQARAIARMKTLIGHPWNLLKLNCEQGVMWALTDNDSSGQLVGGFVIVGLAAIGLALSIS